MYFGVNDAFALSGSVPQCCITIDYYDTGGSSGSLRLQYDSNTGSDLAAMYKDGGSVTLGTTNRWKRKIYYVSDAYFGNRQNNGADFRIALQRAGGGTFYLDRVLVTSGAPRPAVLDVNPTSFSHTILRGSSLPGESFTIRNVGGLPINYTITPTAGWLSATPSAGTGSGETDSATINYNVAALPSGSHFGALHVAGPNASNSPQTITVNLLVYTYGDLDHDLDVDQSDFGRFQACMQVTAPPPPAQCEEADFNGDAWIDLTDFDQFRQCMQGPDQPPGC
jgi:hypothetical protein